MKIHGFAAVLVSMGAFAALAADTWYVNPVDGVDATGRGTSAQNAFLTLQYAHDRATAGDTIVAAPGNYDQGFGLASGHAHTNRLCVTKKLYFVSSTPKAAHIVGAFDPDTGADGPNAYRCVLVTDKGYGTTFTDFTFRDGASDPAGGDTANTASSSIGNGGGLLVYGVRSTAKSSAIFKVYLVDCVISNCVSKWGGAMHGGTAIRCLLAHNTGTSFGRNAASAALWNSVVFDTIGRGDERPAVGNNCRVANCAIVGSAAGFSRNGYAWNTVFSEITGTETNAAGAASTANITTINCIGRNTMAQPFVNPLWDWRLLPNVPGAESGLMSDLTDQILLPEGTEMTDFNGKPIDTTKSNCTLGPVQEIASEVSGVITVKKGTVVNGVTAPFKAYMRCAGEYPQLLALRPTSAGFFRFKRSVAYGGATFNYLDYEGKCVFAPPPYFDQSYDITEVTYDRAYWCKPDADAAVADGTEDHPYRTIQAAVDAGKAQYDVDGKGFLINCLPGVYAEGSRTSWNHDNRLVIPDKCPCLIRSTGGAAATVIKGAVSPNPTMDDAYPGCGPGAMRCVSVEGSNDGQCALQGFTFADGHSDCANYSVDAHSDRVGGIFCKTWCDAVQILDSVFTNCAAVRGGVAYYGAFRRCKFYDCVSYGGVFRYGTLISCYVDTSCKIGKGGAGASANKVIGSGQCALNVTYLGTSDPVGSWIYCSIWGKSYCPNIPQYGTVYTPKWDSVSTRGGYGAVSGEVFRADETAHDVAAVYSASPGLHAVRYPERGTAEWGVFASNLCAYADSDLLGQVPKRLYSGANSSYVDSVYVPKNAGIGVTGATPDANGIIEVESSDFAITVSAAATGTRPCVGFTANGETNLFPLSTPYAITYADVVAENGIVIDGIYAPHWYVNPDPAVGNDGNSGFRPDVPKRTLAAAMAATGLASGDTVHAAAGTYNEGSMDWEKNGKTVFRVAVKSGVTLVGDEGAEKTIIVGAPDTTASANATYPGFGPNAMHCAFLNSLAKLRGFTLTGGYTDVYTKDTYSSDWVVPVTGGGLCGNTGGRDNAYMYDCIISNNYAYTGGGTRWVNAVNCRITDNHTISDGGNARESNLFGCYLNRGYQGTTSTYSGCQNITYNSYNTYGPDNWTYDGTIANRAIAGASSGIAYVSNCVVLGTCGGASAMTNKVYNTVFANGRGSLSIDTESCHVATDGMPGMFDAAGRPLPGCPAVDRGNRDNLPLFLRGYAADLTGTQRVYNRQVDVGALEGDWRARYRSDIGQRFAVNAATEDVVESGSGTVLVNEGESISADVAAAAAGRKYVLRFRLDAGDEAVITAGGTETVYSTPGDIEAVFAPVYGTPLAVTVASRAGTVELLECRSNAGAAIYFR